MNSYPIHLIVEGDTDVAFYSRIVDDMHLTCTVYPGPGKNGILAFAKGYIGQKQQNYFCIRDRDFDYQPGPTIIRDAKNENLLCTGLACLENYLIDPDALYAFMAIYRNGIILKKPDHVYTDSPTEYSPKKLAQLFVKSAVDLIPYQAARWTLGEIRKQVPSLRTNPFDTDDQLPNDRDERSCLMLAQDLVQRTQAKAHNLCKIETKVIFDKYLANFSSTSFIESGEYLKWFHGKHLLTALKSHLTFKNPTGFVSSYISWAAAHAETPSYESLKQELLSLLAELARTPPPERVTSKRTAGH